MHQKIFFLPLVVFLLTACGDNANAGKKNDSGNPAAETVQDTKEKSKPDKTIFDIKAAKIVFNYTGPETGTETLFFDDYGNVAVLLTDMKSKYSVNKQTVIWKDKRSTIINHEKKTAVKSGFRPKSTEPPGIAELDEKTRNNIGYKKLANETIAGKSCEVWFNAKQNFKYCLWKKIALKEELGTSINKVAISVEEISEIPASVMEVPKDYKQ